MKRLLMASALAGAAILAGLAVPTAANASTSTCLGTAAPPGRTIIGALVVPAGAACQVADVTVVGSVTVGHNAQLYLNDATIRGSLTVTGGSIDFWGTDAISGSVKLALGRLPSYPVPEGENYLCGTSIGGNLTIGGSNVLVAVERGCLNGAPITVAGNVRFSDNTQYLNVGVVNAAGNLAITGNTGGGLLTGGSYAGESCAANHPQYVLSGVTIDGVLVASGNC